MHSFNHSMPATNKTTTVQQATRGKALVVEDDVTNRLILKSLLQRYGYSVIQAENGLLAIERFHEQRPDIIFMDVMMPVMDGLEATRRIKSSCGDDFVPVIFLTALNDDKACIECIESGGDDYIVKPYNHAIFNAKVQAIERMRDLHRHVRELYARTQQEQDFAEQVYSRVVTAGNTAMDHIMTLLRPTKTFSGDMLLTLNSPQGNFYALMADFTGHGLSAALGAIPVAEVFRSMIAKGFDPESILKAINRKLCLLLPAHMFMAMQFVAMSHDFDYAKIWNCGMPDVLVLDGNSGAIKARVASQYIPLGIQEDCDYSQTSALVPVVSTDRIILVSDGLTEAVNNRREQFGQERFERLLTAAPLTDSITVIERALNDFCHHVEQADDISMASIPCDLELLIEAKEFKHKAREVHQDLPSLADAVPEWECTISLRGKQLRTVNPVPMMMNQIQELEGLQEHRQAIFMILTELYVNAIDHGVLGLDSKLKHSSEGFVGYFMERGERLNALCEGCISLQVKLYLTEQKYGRILVSIEDSGPGFDYNACLKAEGQSGEHTYAGRGIHLVNTLCESLRYQGSGNQVEAIYAWSQSA